MDAGEESVTRRRASGAAELVGFMKQLSKRSLVLTVLLLIGCLTRAQADPAEKGSFGALLSKSEHVFFSAGVSYAVYRQDVVVETGAFGTGDIKNQRKMTACTPLCPASLTKPIAASLILEAAQTGLIDLDSSF